MKACAKYLVLISAYADGELAESESRDVEKHLDECDSCSALLALYREISTAAAESTVQAPDRLREGVMKKIQSDDKLRIIDYDKRRKVIRAVFTRYVPVAACLAIILLALPRILDLNRVSYNMGRSDTGGSSSASIMASGATGGAGSSHGMASVGEAEMSIAPGANATAPDSPEEASAEIQPSGVDLDNGFTSDNTGGGDSQYAESELVLSPTTESSYTEEPSAAMDDVASDESGNRSELDDGVWQVMPVPAPNDAPPTEQVNDSGDSLRRASIRVTGELPGFLRAYDAIIVDDVTRHYIIPHDEALAFIGEISGRDGVTIVLPDGDWDYAVVVHYTGG